MPEPLCMGKERRKNVSVHLTGWDWWTTSSLKSDVPESTSFQIACCVHIGSWWGFRMHPAPASPVSWYLWGGGDFKEQDLTLCALCLSGECSFSSHPSLPPPSSRLLFFFFFLLLLLTKVHVEFRIIMSNKEWTQSPASDPSTTTQGVTCHQDSWSPKFLGILGFLGFLGSSGIDAPPHACLVNP